MSSDKLSFKDALLEAGVRDYHSIEKDGSWVPSGKLEAGMEKLIGDQRPARRFFCSPLFKGVAIAASFAVLFGVLASVKPVREAFGSMFAHTTETEDTTGAVVTDGETTKELTGTDPLPEKTAQISETAPAPVTVPAATEAETEPDPQTEEEWIDHLLGKLAKNGYDDTTWTQLLSFGEAAYERCAKRYQTGLQYLRLNEDGVISFMIFRFVSDDVNKNAAELFENMSLPDPDRLTEEGFFGELRTRQWISAFRAKLRKYAKKKKNKEIAEESPSLYKYLCWIGFDDYICDAETEDIYACFEFIAKASDRGYPVRRELKEKRFDEALEYCVKHRNDTDIPDNVRAAMGSYLQDLIRGDVYMRGEIYKMVQRFGNGFPYISDTEGYTQAFIEYALGVLPECCEEEARVEFPVTYKIMSIEGFDNYKPGTPDISLYARDALRAVDELYNAVVHGIVPSALWEKRQPIESDDDRVGLPERTKAIYNEYYLLSDFYDYFEKYLDCPVINGFARNGYWFNIVGNKVYMFEDGRGTLNIKEMTAKLVEQNGNTAKIAVDVSQSYGAYPYTKSIIFDIKEDEGGIRVTGGIFFEKLLDPEYAKAGSASYIIRRYLVMQEAQYEFNSYMSGALYNSYDEVPEEYRKVLTKDVDYPLYYCEKYYDSYELDRYTTEEAAEAITKTSDVYDGVALYPDKAKVTHKPVFDYGFEDQEYGFTTITTYDVILAMDVIECSDDRILFSLDFIKEENGKSKNVTYTFEVTKTVDETGYIYEKLVGGTFYTDVIMAK